MVKTNIQLSSDLKKMLIPKDDRILKDFTRRKTPGQTLIEI